MKKYIIFILVTLFATNAYAYTIQETDIFSSFDHSLKFDGRGIQSEAPQASINPAPYTQKLIENALQDNPKNQMIAGGKKYKSNSNRGIHRKLKNKNFSGKSSSGKNYSGKTISKNKSVESTNKKIEGKYSTNKNKTENQVIDPEQNVNESNQSDQIQNNQGQND